MILFANGRAWRIVRVGQPLPGERFIAWGSGQIGRRPAGHTTDYSDANGLVIVERIRRARPVPDPRRGYRRYR